MKASRPAWMPKMNEPLDTDDLQADPRHHEDREHRGDLRDQPAFQRIADAIDDNGCVGTVTRGSYEQQTGVIDARLRRERQPQKQDNEEIATAFTVPSSNLSV